VRQLVIKKCSSTFVFDITIRFETKDRYYVITGMPDYPQFHSLLSDSCLTLGPNVQYSITVSCGHCRSFIKEGRCVDQVPRDTADKTHKQGPVTFPRCMMTQQEVRTGVLISP